MMTIEKAMILDNFELWLASKDPEETIGIPNCMDHCPIAEYLKDAAGMDVFIRQSTINKPSEPGSDEQPGDFLYPLPPWARSFVAYVDATDTDAQHEVTALEARLILDQIGWQ